MKLSLSGKSISKNNSPSTKKVEQESVQDFSTDQIRYHDTL